VQKPARCKTDHDFRVDVIVTPTAALRTPNRRRPPGILWDNLDDEKRAAIPVLSGR
jgi:5-formyltetrahydrofolate cyclo-ligase